MAIQQSHTRPKEQRKSMSWHNNRNVNGKDYEYVEDMLALIICDIVNGLQKSDIMAKLQNQMYEGQRKPYTQSTSKVYYYTAMQRIREDREKEIEELRDKLYSQYYSLYADAVKNDNTLVAKQILDSIAKVFAIAPDKKNVDVQISDNKVHISFGFDTEDKEEINK